MTKYADRAFISINGARLADIESASLKQNKGRRAVGTMTPDGYNRGFVESNWEIDLSITMALQNSLARPKLESLDYENNDIRATFIVGAELFQLVGLFHKDVSDDASGIGSEVKTVHSFGALKCVDAVGNSVLFNIQL